MTTAGSRGVKDQERRLDFTDYRCDWPKGGRYSAYIHDGTEDLTLQDGDGAALGKRTRRRKVKKQDLILSIKRRRGR